MSDTCLFELNFAAHAASSSLTRSASLAQPASAAAGGWPALLGQQQQQQLAAAALPVQRAPPPPPPLFALAQYGAPPPPPPPLADSPFDVTLSNLFEPRLEERPGTRLVDAVDWKAANLCKRHQITGRCSDTQCAVLRGVLEPSKRAAALSRIHQSSSCALCGPMAGHVLGSHADAPWRAQFGLPARH